jgi:hypothetical protein
MLTTRQLATLRAALRFWSEEMHTTAHMRPYFDTRKQVPLSQREIATLRKQLSSQQLRYAGFDELTGQLTSTELFARAELARSETQVTHIVTVLLPTA